MSCKCVTYLSNYTFFSIFKDKDINETCKPREDRNNNNVSKDDDETAKKIYKRISIPAILHIMPNGIQIEATKSAPCIDDKTQAVAKQPFYNFKTAFNRFWARKKAAFNDN